MHSKMNKCKIAKLILKASEIPCREWDLSTNNDLVMCYDCKSPLFYVKINWGIVAEENDYKVMYNRSNRVYVLREIGFELYCAECGSLMIDYSKYFYPEDKLVYVFDELDSDERAEIECCLQQFNQKGDFKSRYEDALFKELKNKLLEYEKKHPIKCQKKKK